MDIVRDWFLKGGPVMWPLLALSFLSLSVTLERLWFWLRILTQEKQIVGRVLEAASESWTIAADIARKATDQPIGRFLYAPLSLPKADPETFRLALEASAEDELAGMRRGEKFLEVIIALSPILGLLGTVLGLIQSLGEIRLGDIGTDAVQGVTQGIGESLISTATGLVIAMASQVFYRFFQALVLNQVKIFRKAGNELELLYRQYPPDFGDIPTEKVLTGRIQPQRDNFNSTTQRGKKNLMDESESSLDTYSDDSSS
ncbi:MAG: MotA/TolQ/ExbB proton channel family protein [Cyanobacteria bacterium P01_A01_bin.45]